jgi:hypothetical protein
MEVITDIIYFERLKNLTFQYLSDAGFDTSMYDIKENKDRQCLEIFFKCRQAMDYILQDLQKTPFEKVIFFKKHYSRMLCFKK